MPFQEGINSIDISGWWYHGSHEKILVLKKEYDNWWGFFLTRHLEYAGVFGKYIHAFTIKSGNGIFNFRRKDHVAKLSAFIDKSAFIEDLEDIEAFQPNKNVEEYLKTGFTQYFQQTSILNALRKANFKGYFNWEDRECLNCTIFDYNILHYHGLKY